MGKVFKAYLGEVERQLRTGEAGEHAYRSALQRLLEGLGERVTATNEPRRVACGAPDFLVSRDLGHGPLTVGYVEAKDLGADLDEVERSDQLKRYRNALDNLILTDYLEFRWYVRGQLERKARLAEVVGGRPDLDPDGEKKVRYILEAFLSRQPEAVSDPAELARRMAQLTHLIRDLIIADLESDNASQTLRDLRQAFSEVLVPDLSVPDFADMYAQTLAYGLFAARMNHRGPEPFTRRGAAAEIPRANPFLRRFFATVAGPDLDDEVYAGFVDDIAQLLAHADVESAMARFGEGGRRDPIFHFYETFLAAYDPELREKRGVYYTPEPVVSYIVRSVDWILKEKFGLPDGLADDSTVEIEYTDDEGRTVREEVPKVLILDPACGTGTFLYAVVDLIRSRFMERGDAGKWRQYVRERLLPRLFGFELLMAPYAVAHLKLGMQLAGLDLPEEQRADWAYEFAGGERLGIYLTNTLEEGAKRSELLFGRYISEEANAAARVKRDLPIMVIIGNPPYSGHSANKGRWIRGLLRGKLPDGTTVPSYYEVGGKPLRERNPKWLQDDYVKFIRFAQWRIERTGLGVVAFVTNHSYLDNPTFRGMREKLTRGFTDVFVLDLHGSARRRDRAGSEEPDENVFDIQQGVAIAIFARARGDGGPGGVRRADLWGTREWKYDWLADNSIATTQWQPLHPRAPWYLFAPEDAGLAAEYEKEWRLKDAFVVAALGFQTHRDAFAVAFERDDLRGRIRDLRDRSVTDDELRQRYSLADNRDWHLADARRAARSDPHWEQHLRRCLFRPFDERFCCLTTIAMDYPRPEVHRHMLLPNIALLVSRQTATADWRHALVTRLPAESCAVSAKKKEGNYVMPLYAYFSSCGRPLEGGERGVEVPREPNLTREFTEDIAGRVDLSFVEDGLGDLEATFGPEDVFNYIYAILYSPTYRSRYAEFLKRDFPRIPLTGDRGLFRALCGLGAELVALHLMESPKLQDRITRYPVPGDNIVEKGHPKYLAPGEPDPETGQPLTAGRVYISKNDCKTKRRGQYFEGVPLEVWGYHVGGYQVCEKWLKDRRGRALSLEDIEHYERIVVALSETIRLQAEIDEVIEAHGGWPIR